MAATRDRNLREICAWKRFSPPKARQRTKDKFAVRLECSNCHSPLAGVGADPIPWSGQWCAEAAQVAQMRYVGAYSEQEMAETLGVRTVQLDWEKARLTLTAA
jgi:hypothetical protein